MSQINVTGQGINPLPKSGVSAGPSEAKGAAAKTGAPTFSGMVEKGLEKLNAQMTQADKMAARLAAGEEMDIPEVMLAITKADINFRLFVQMRNKALSAYEEIMRLQF